MEIKVGGVYKTRGGERVEIVSKWDNHEWIWKGHSDLTYNKRGEQGIPENDLIAPWHDEEPARVDSNREWMSESPTPEVGKWIGWNGGECPVHPETIVEVSYPMGMDKSTASALIWGHSLMPIIAYRIIKEHVEPREFWVAGNVAYEALIAGAVHVREVLDDD